jgi:hypothetical protein
VVREHPDTWVYRYNLALNLRCLSYVADAAGRPAEAEATRQIARDIEEKLVREHPDSSSVYYEAALVYLRLAERRAPRAARNGAADSIRLGEECTGHALSMLEAAEKAGYFRIAEGAKQLNTDKHLDPIRSREGFRNLIARVRQK